MTTIQKRLHEIASRIKQLLQQLKEVSYETWGNLADMQRNFIVSQINQLESEQASLMASA